MRLTAFALFAILGTALALAPSAAARPCEGPGQAHIEDRGDFIAFWWDNPDWIRDCEEDVDAAANDASEDVAHAVGTALARVDAVRDMVEACNAGIERGELTITDYGDYIRIDGYVVRVQVDCGPVHFDRSV